MTFEMESNNYSAGTADLSVQRMLITELMQRYTP